MGCFSIANTLKLQPLPIDIVSVITRLLAAYEDLYKITSPLLTGQQPSWIQITLSASLPPQTVNDEFISVSFYFLYHQSWLMIQIVNNKIARLEKK